MWQAKYMGLSWMQVTAEKVSNEQEGLRKEKECAGQIFAIKMLVQEHLGKDEKVVCSLYGLNIELSIEMITLLFRLWEKPG